MRNRSRSRSRDRRYIRDRDAEFRDRNRDRDRRGADGHRDTYYPRRSVSRSRSRSRDRPRLGMKDGARDENRELREVKRILSTVDNAQRANDRPRPVRNDLSTERTREPDNKKKKYDEYSASEKLRNDDDLKVKRGRYDDRDIAPIPPKETEKENSITKNGKTTGEVADAQQGDDDQYDDAALKEIEKFLSSTTGGEKKVPNGKVKDQTADDETGTDKKDEADSDIDVLWEDEEEKARREAQEAEERRKRRQEIASKYSAGNSHSRSQGAATGASASVPNTPMATGKSLAVGSPQSSGRKRAHTIPDTPKSEVAVVDVHALSTADPSNGGSSISMPTAMHLAKLDLGGEDEGQGQGAHEGDGAADKQQQPPIVGSAVAAAAREVLSSAPSRDQAPQQGSTPTATAGTGASAVPVAEIEVDAERRQLEAERSALELEERREQRGAAKGYGGAYGAGGRVEFDMFSSSPSAIEQLQQTGAGRKGYIGPNGKYGDTGIGGRRALREALLDGELVGDGDNPHLQSNWDDGEGYYKARIGEVIGERFQILGVVGKGVFSTVLKCVDLRVGDGSTHVAVKMIRNNDTMRKAAEKEKSILLSIAEHDPDNKKFCVRLLTHLEYRNHVALVFEYQSMNLRETLKKFGKDVGINIGAVRMYGRQLFVALKHLMDLRVVHADIKLDNILCSADLKQVKLCDFGSAFRETDTDTDPTPYLVSRFYRAPEIILGMQYDRAIDLWSVCASLYELFTGHVMFPGRTNNEMLRLMMAVKGRFPNKLIKTHMRQYEILSLEPHFDPDLRFRQYEADPITGKTILRLIDVAGPTRDLAAVLRSSKAGADDMKLVTAFTDLLEKGLSLDPAKRLTVLEAFRHPFLSSKL